MGDGYRAALEILICAFCYQNFGYVKKLKEFFAMKI